MANTYIPIRFSHITRDSGPGAIVRGPNSLMVIQDISKWTDKNGFSGATQLPYVEQVRHRLGIKDTLLMEPPTATIVESQSNRIDGVCVPATRFPFWARCPKCGMLYYRPWSKEHQDTQNPICQNQECVGHNRTRLEQVTYVVVHPSGYLADVPWFTMTHYNSKGPRCEVRDLLFLDLDTNLLHCKSCNAQNKFSIHETNNIGVGNIQPWLFNNPIPDEHINDGQAHIRKVNDVLTYSPVVKTALVIPPESRIRKGTLVDLLYRNSADVAMIDEKMKKARNSLQNKTVFSPLLSKYRCNFEEIQKAYNDLKAGYPYYGNEPGEQLEEGEYNAFLEPFDAAADEDFVTHHYGRELKKLREKALSGLNLLRTSVIDTLVKVDRLKEVRVFNGFTRDGFGETDTRPMIMPDIVGNTSWLPAVVLYGEGLFFTLNETDVSRWENNQNVKDRINPIKKRFEDSGRAYPQATARFVMLHTLSHLVIRQLEQEGGYPAASLSERIYCAPVTAPKPMCGILIYATAADVTGTLGGLAELAEPRRFLGIFIKALDHAAWCSSDPVCSENKGQGPNLLNRAACHACALIPETACQYGNILLDRVFVKGDKLTDLPSLFEIGEP